MPKKKQVSPTKVPTPRPSTNHHIRIPPFWGTASGLPPALWFAQIEALFATADVEDEYLRYFHVLPALDPATLHEVVDIVSKPLGDTPYTTLKNHLIDRLSLSQKKRTLKLLQSEDMGDRTPSQFLRHLQSVAPADVPESFLKTVWSPNLSIYSYIW